MFFKIGNILLTCDFEKLVEVSKNEFDINPLYCVSLLGLTMQYGFESTGNALQTLQKKELFFLFKKLVEECFHR